MQSSTTVLSSSPIGSAITTRPPTTLRPSNSPISVGPAPLAKSDLPKRENGPQPHSKATNFSPHTRVPLLQNPSAKTPPPSAPGNSSKTTSPTEPSFVYNPKA